MTGRYEEEEYLEQDEDEREAAGRRKSLIALAVMAVLVVAGIVLVERLRDVSIVQDCLDDPRDELQRPGRAAGAGQQPLRAATPRPGI